MSSRRSPHGERGLDTEGDDGPTVDVAPPPPSLGSQPSLAAAGAAPPDAVERVPPPEEVIPTDELPRGAAIDRYVVLDQLGKGGMGVVYAAYDPELDRKVAIKLLRPQHAASGDADSRMRLLREAQALARLSHPNVVSVFDVGTAFNQVFVAMEFVDGGTLRDWLKQPRSQHQILEMFYLAGRGLAAAHACGLVHRDFKPDTVMTEGNELLKSPQPAQYRRVRLRIETLSRREPS